MSVPERNFDGLNLSLLNNAMKNNKAPPGGRRYSDEIKKFAVTIQYYSPKAHNFLRSIIPLPAPSLIKRWARLVDCEPGFITEALDILKSEILDQPEKKDCCLVFDAMAIRKQTLWDAKQDEFVAFVNCRAAADRSTRNHGFRGPGFCPGWITESLEVPHCLFPHR